MAIKDTTFEKEVYKELDFVWKTYINTWVWIKHTWVRRVRTPKLIHIYWWESFFKALEKSLDSNPLMAIILKAIWKPEYRYFPIYSRNNSGYKAKKDDMRWPTTFYDKVNRVRDYAWNKIDFGLDRVVWWYPPILTWLFVERPSNERHWDLLLYLIKKRYASKKINTSETSNWGTETKSSWGSEERVKNSVTVDNESNVSNSTESTVE